MNEMRMLSFSKSFLSVILLVCLFSFSGIAAACSCNIPPPCVAYTRADAVFIGKLVKIEETKESYLALAHYEVEKIFKGEVSKNEIIKFSPAIGCGTSFKI